MDKVTYFIDILTLFDETYAGIANVNHQITKYFFENRNDHTQFFYRDKIVKKESIARLIHEKSGRALTERLASGTIHENTLEASVKRVRTKTVGIFQHVKSVRNLFDYDVQIMYDLTALLMPEFHYQETLAWHVPKIEKDLESNSLCVCISNSTKEDLVKYLGFPEERAIVSHLGCDHGLRERAPYRKVLNELEDRAEKFILILGTVEPRKNIETILGFLERNPSLLEKYKFIFLGRDAGKDGWGKTFKERLSKVKIDEKLKTNKIIHFDYVTEEEKNMLLMTAECMIYPSFYEGFGLPVLEALSVGCPTLASISSSVPEIGEEAVRYFDPCNLQSFETAFDQFTNELKDRRREIVGNCLKQSAKFSWNRFIDVMLNRIEEDISGTPAIRVETKSVFQNLNREFQILLIKLDHMGDFILSIPAIMTLKEKFKDAKIDIIVGEWNVPLAKQLNVFRNIYVYNFYAAKSSLRPEEKAREGNELLNGLPRYDIAIDLRRPHETRFLLAKVSASLKVGYKSFSDYDKEIDICLDTEMDEKGKIIENNRLSVSLQLLKLVDAIPMNVLNLPKWIEYKPTGKQMAVFPGAGVDSRQWPVEYYVHLVREILHKGLADKVNVYLSYFEKKLADPFAAIQGVNVLIGLEFDEMLKSLATNRLVIANNSFAPHVCSYLGIPVIAIYSGVETIWEWGPPFGSVTIVYSDVPCLPCHDIKKNCPYDLICLKSITPEHLLKIIEKRVEEGYHFPQTPCYAYSDTDIKNIRMDHISQKSPLFNFSETSQCRERLKKYCIGYGVDIGYGGDPIIPSAITIDLPTPYAKCGEVPLNLGGDARRLRWFTDESLDYVYSSHLLEDFPPGETVNILCEWLRVLKVGGNLILFLPDENKFREHCKQTGQPYNPSHKVETFSLEYLKTSLHQIPNIDIIHEVPLIDRYCFEIVIKKTRPTHKKTES